MAVAAPFLGAVTSPGGKPNAKKHGFIDTTNDCAKCHVQGGPSNQTSNALCTAAGCHDADIGKNLRNKTGLHGRSSMVQNGACGDCHDEHHGTGFDLINDKKDKVETIAPGKRLDATPWAIIMQVGENGNLGAGPNSFGGSHDMTGYKLIGGHKVTQDGSTKIDSCDDCHKPTQLRPDPNNTGVKSRTFLGTDQECLKCHDNYHKFPKGDKFEDCLICHTFVNWDKKFNLTGFNHDKETKFALNGAHNSVGCAECHAKGKPFAPVPHDTCETCHESDSIHGKTFTTKKCIFCHTEASWKNEKVVSADHKKFAKFDAVGAHSKLSCAQCHRGLKTTPPKEAEDENNCEACHNNIHGKKWMEDQEKGCVTCHSNARWTPLTVKIENHDTWSNPKWNLAGGTDNDPSKSRHLNLECIRCHLNLTDVPPNHECITCHVDWHAFAASTLEAGKPATAKPKSRGNDCTSCHTTEDWFGEGVVVDHDKTRFPLTGKHKEVGCYDCHKGSEKTKDFKHDTACNSCHGDPHLGKLANTCDKCHNTADWRDEKFDHNKDSRFALTGKHLQVDCYKCHLDLGFKGTPSGCPQCHSDYHKGAWGPISCDQCHNERRWNVERGTLVFESLHNFGEVVLSGVHDKLACETCHAPNPRWLMNGMGGECNQCHPDVHLGGRGQECHTCHTQNAWLPAEFNHLLTGFPLMGAHRFVGCAECHRGNIYTGTPDECAFCHADDAATSPHGFCDPSFDCNRCHDMARWQGTGAGLPTCPP